MKRRRGTAGSAPPALAAELDTFPAGRAALARADLELRELAGGADNRVWRLVGADLDWVVRVAGPRDARLAVDRRREEAAARLAAAHGFAPRIEHVCAERGLLVTAYVHGARWSRDDARSAAGTARFATRLRALHDVPVPADLPVVDPRAAIARYLALAPPAATPVERSRLAALASAALRLVDAAPRALCHHDLHHRNVIDAGALVFVDWEYAGRGEPLLDLAAFAAYHDFDAPRRAALLAAYTTRRESASGPEPHDAARLATTRFDAAVLLFDCLQALWYDAADAWHSLAPESRFALVERLAHASV